MFFGGKKSSPCTDVQPNEVFLLIISHLNFSFATVVQVAATITCCTNNLCCRFSGEDSLKNVVIYCNWLDFAVLIHKTRNHSFVLFNGSDASGQNRYLNLQWIDLQKVFIFSFMRHIYEWAGYLFESESNLIPSYLIWSLRSQHVLAQTELLSEHGCCRVLLTSFYPCCNIRWQKCKNITPKRFSENEKKVFAN